MKFKVSTAGNSYANEEDRKKLEKIGFSFKETKYGFMMKNEDEVEVEIKDLEELLSFSDYYGSIVIEDREILIYDDYLES